MLVTVVGVKRNVSFSTKEGATISGSNIYVEHLENGVEGYMAEKYFLNATTFDSSNIVVGDTLNLEFNRYGKIAAFHKETKNK